jgi:hypothetical protein
MAAAFGGCTFHGDPVYMFGVYNQSDEAVIVRFAAGDQGYLVEPGEAGIAAQGFGELSGPILILDVRCQQKHSIDVTTQRAAVRIAADGVAMLQPSDTMPAGQLVRTDLCPPS